MGENSGIEWTDHTFNPWWGCARVSPACDFCYAATLAHRVAPGEDYWTVNGPRRQFGDKHWNEPLRWQAAAEKAGTNPRVFCASMADVFDKNAPQDARPRLWELIRRTPRLRWLLLTKRIGNAPSMLPTDWDRGYQNVALGISVVTQAEADRDIPKLLDIPAWIRFVSIEPMLGPIDLYRGGFTFLEKQRSPRGRLYGSLDWVIAGGESGTSARPVSARWLRKLRDACKAAGVPFFFKQWGEWAPPQQVPESSWVPHHDYVEGEYMIRCGKKKAGRTLDGETNSELPDFTVTVHAPRKDPESARPF